MRICFLAILGCFFSYSVFAQLVADPSYSKPIYRTYKLAGIHVTGINNVDEQALILISGLNVGDDITIPGEQLANAIKQLWKQQLFSDVKIIKEKEVDQSIYLRIEVTELSRLSRFTLLDEKGDGIKGSEADDIREAIDLFKEMFITDHLISSTKNKIRNYYIDKGYFNCEVFIKQRKDTIIKKHDILDITIKKNPKVKVDQIEIVNNTKLSDFTIKKQLKETKERLVFAPFHGFGSLVSRSLKGYFKGDSTTFNQKVMEYASERIRVNIFKSSKFLEKNFIKDKDAVLAKYNSLGYRDAKIVSDTIYASSTDGITIKIQVQEGNRYYFRNITWLGNSKYPTSLLSGVLGIEKGDIYNQDLLDRRLSMNPNGTDVSSLYMDNGYLFFQVNPVEVLVENDSIDLEMHIYEGKQARINKITVTGNTKTNDHVVMRELRTKPGQLFSRADIIRTQRELAQLGYFDPEKLNVIPKPNPSNGTVDIEYVVQEKPSDQLEMSASWGGAQISQGAGIPLFGTLGVTFNNFSTRNFFKKNAWAPLPAGDGQRLSLRAQSNGPAYQGYTLSFTEPWLGGKKPNSFSVTAWHNLQSNGAAKYVEDASGNDVPNPNRTSLAIWSASIALGKRLQKPDNYFSLLHEFTFQHYDMNQWAQFTFSNGTANNFFYKMTLSRNSVDQPIYPRKGSNLVSSIQTTLPYSYINSEFRGIDKDYSTLEPQEKYKWVEYYKIKFSADWYTELANKLVLRTKVGFGFLSYYNKNIGTAPFERFYLGGSGLTNFALDAREIIALRGYNDNSVFPLNPQAENSFTQVGQPIITKYTMEMRYPVSLNPQATIFFLSFLEAGNTWYNFKDYDPFNVKRSAGVGIRAFLPMFGMLGLDWGYRFDDIETNPTMPKSQIHFTIGTNIGEL